MKRLLVSAALIALILTFTSAAVVVAQPFPSHPIQLLTPGTAGLAQDVSARVIGEEVGKALNAQVIVQNKPGASMTLAVDAVARAKKDGYTILYASATPLIYAPASKPEVVPYNPLKDLEALGGEAIFPFTVTVRADAPWNTFPELIEYAKKNPEKLRVSTPGVLSTDAYNVEIVQSLTGAKFTHVPMQSGPALALLGGHIELTFSPITEVAQYVRAGKLKLLLLSNKMNQFPAVPLITDFGYKQDLIRGWFAFFAPAGIPAEVKKALVPAVEKAFKNPDVISKIEKMEFSVHYRSPEVFTKLWAAEFETAKALTARLGIKK